MIGYNRKQDQYLPPKKVKCIFFDKGGTLSKPVHKGPDRGEAQYRKLMSILNADGNPMEFGEIISERDRKYKKWALDNKIELSEEDRCTKFLFPDFNEEIVKANAEELTLIFSHSKGERVLRSEARSVVQKLHESGYKIGVISNTVSRVLVPGELEEAGISPYVSVLIMSSITGIRKPEPAMFTEASLKAGVEPEYCAYIGDQPDRDVEGPRLAGFGLNIILKTRNYPDENLLSEIQVPDITIEELEELIELFI